VNQKILFVDDEPAALESYRRMLRGDFEIATATSGEEGLASLRTRGPFAIVISDMQMGGMNGVQFLKGARQIAPSTMRLLLSGHMDLDVAAQAVNEASVFRLLLKPCEKSVLAEAIATALTCYLDRKEDRVRVELPVRVYREPPGLPLQLAHTIDISKSGARLAGLEEEVEIGEVLRVECGHRQAPFRVVWKGARDTVKQGVAGLACLAVDANIWKLDAGQLDDQPMMRARAVQSALLPHEQPSLKTLEYAGICAQARMIGGDYYDFLNMGPGIVGFALADIAGKGIAAALLMANLHGSLCSEHGTEVQDIPRFLASVNRHLYSHTPNERYATFFFGRYSDATRTLHYANCGHLPPLLLRQGGAVEKLHATATVLGLFESIDCSVAEVQLEPGDLLSIYTDGITETTGYAGEEFGETRLLESLRENQNLETACILRNVEEAVRQFRLGEQEDDLTLVIACAR